MAETGGKGGNRIITQAGEASGHGIDGGCPYQAEDVAGVLVDQAVATAASDRLGELGDLGDERGAEPITSRRKSRAAATTFPSRRWLVDSPVARLAVSAERQ